MDITQLIALLSFCLVSSGSPGPNNTMLMASGANFGLRRTLPHLLGVGIGFMVMLFLVGTGLIQLFDQWPQSYIILKWACIIYLLYLAWKTATAAGLSKGDKQGRPMTFLQAAAFQWVNPKGWMMAVTAMTAYAPERDLISVVIVTLIFGAVNFPCVTSWASAGQYLARFLQSQKQLIIFNLSMAALLLISLYPLL